jgi:hypothetical protein
MILSVFPKGVSIASKAIVPAITSDIFLKFECKGILSQAEFKLFKEKRNGIGICFNNTKVYYK